MDPNVCWKRINDILNSGEYVETAAEYIFALKGWLDCGGFKLDNFDGELFEAMLSWVRGGCQCAVNGKLI